MKPGDRVRVRALRKHWNAGAAAALSGKTGTVQEDGARALLLVRFDEPVKPWWAGQTPPLAWHFTAEELELLEPAS